MTSEWQSLDNLCLPRRVALRPVFYPFYHPWQCHQAMEILLVQVHHKLKLHDGPRIYLNFFLQRLFRTGHTSNCNHFLISILHL